MKLSGSFSGCLLLLEQSTFFGIVELQTEDINFFAVMLPAYSQGYLQFWAIYMWPGVSYNLTGETFSMLVA